MERAHSPTGRAAVFLDRDGVINRKLPEDHYVSSASEFDFLSGAADGLAILKDLGFVLVVVTNQRGINRGLMTEQDLETVHRHMEAELEKQGVVLDAIYFCPHRKSERCKCRKPEPGMILAAMGDLDIDPSGSYLAGDSRSDVQAGKSVGTKTVRIGEEDDSDADMVFPSLLEFAEFLQRRAGE